MVFKIDLTRTLARVVFPVALVAACGLLVYVIFQNFIVSSFGNSSLTSNRLLLARLVESFPDSARLNYRLARAEMTEVGGDLESAKRHASLAIKLSPKNFNYHLALASIQESQGDQAAAESSIRYAIQLAPSDIETHWRLANILVRRGLLRESLEEFRLALSHKKTLLPASLDLVWHVSGGNINAVRSITARDGESVLTLARFLLANSNADKAAATVRLLDRNALMANPRSGEFVDQLIQAGRIDLALEIRDLVVSNAEQSIIHNGSFEQDAVKGFSQFDWNIAKSEHARIEVDRTIAHSGSRSLRINFTGRDTTQLDQEIRQLIVVRPLARYRLECYVKTADLITPEGPRIVISDAASSVPLARSEPVATGTSDWRIITADFVAPRPDESNLVAVQVSVKRLPRYAYDDPTRGTIWLDDFIIKEQRPSSSK